MSLQVANSLPFYFSKNSVRNAVITGPNFSYEVTTPTELLYKGDRVTTITRVNPDGKRIVVGEFVWHVYSSTMVRLYDDDWVPMRNFLKQDSGSMWSSYVVLSSASSDTASLII